MKLNKDDIANKSPKQLRTLRNQLNNRIGAFQGGNEAVLKESHPLFGLFEEDCKDLVLIVKRKIKNSKN
jgi:hypothetical protein